MSKKSKKFKGATGNIATHIKILNMIVDQNLSNVLILEDDSIQNTKLPKVSELPKRWQHYFQDNLPSIFMGKK